MQKGRPCGHHMRRFMEICLLELLRGGTAHGYALAERLGGFGFAPDELKYSTLYRTLRSMEQSGWVGSFWESGGQGPKKRVYSLTKQGFAALEEWILILRQRKERISKLLDLHEQAGDHKETPYES